MNSINLYRENNTLIIDIIPIDAEARPSALIVNNTGEAIRKYELVNGSNYIDIDKYQDKNCAIRIVNGKNVIVQRI